MAKKVLMHTCCAPCSVYCIDSLRAENIEPTIFSTIQISILLPNTKHAVIVSKNIAKK